MRNRILIFILSALILLPAYAQNRSIKFQEGEWNSILKKASKKDKLIFLDCYTSWCGPCKMLSRTVFTNDTVADFYNKNFICVKMDMEKGEGPELAKKYNVAAYPTLLYVNGRGELVHNVTGYQAPAKLISEGSTALEGTETLSAYTQRYDNGERDESFIRKYIDRLSKAYVPKLQEKVATEFISTFDDDKFYTRDCWQIVVYNISDPMSPVLKRMFRDRNRFYQIVAKDSVDMFLDYTFRSRIGKYVWNKTKTSKFNETEYNNYLQYVKGIHNWEKKPQYIATLYTARHWIDGNHRAMLDEMHNALRYGIFNDDAKLSYIQGHIIQLCTTDNQPLIAEAYEWMRQIADEYPMGYYRSEYMRLQARLLTAQGKSDEAKDLEEKARKVRMSQ